MAELGILALWAVAVVAISAVYFAPSAIAFRHSVPQRWLVLAVNALFGLSVVGWVFALYLATRSAPAGGFHVSSMETDGVRQQL